MEITDNDKSDLREVGALINKIDNIGAEYVNTTSDEIFEIQPFFLTVLLGYRFDTTPIELDEIIKIYFLIWEYFRPCSNVQAKKVTEEYFELIQMKHVDMLQKADRETADKKMTIYDLDLQDLKSKALLAAVFYRLNSREALMKMDPIKRSMILIGIKSFIICFETI